MFESLVANILNRFLGSYIEGFDPKQLNIGIWSGDVKLKNLRLKKESLDQLKLPLEAKFGHLGELTLQIPWSNLKGQPVRVIIEDIYLLVSPTLDDNYDAEEEHEKQLKIKKEKLENLETLQAAQAQNKSVVEEAESNESFTESLVTKIVDNLQFTIKNIHIRYEDDSTLTEDPYAIGLKLNELSAVSTDKSWVPSFIAITQRFTRKLVTLKNLSCYMNTSSCSILDGNDEDHDVILTRFKNSFAEEANMKETIQYLLKPVSGSGKITVHKAGSTDDFPHVKAELFFQEFGIALDSQQYRDLLWTASKFHWYLKTQRFKKLKPNVPVSENPRAWFKYAAESVLNVIHEKNYKWSWEYFKTRRDQRKAYIRLYKHKVTNPKSFASTESDKREFEQLEDALPFEDIKFYRSLARSEMKRENKRIDASKSAQSNTNGGWFSYLWGSSGTSNDSNVVKEDDPNQLDLKLSEDQRRALYDAIDYNENDAVKDAIDLPRDRVTLDIQASLERGGICIMQKESILTDIVFEGCKTSFYQRPDSFLCNFQLNEFRIEDGTETSLYKHIVSVKQLNSALHTAIHQGNRDEPFFQISYEHNPLDESADSILLGKLKSMTIFYNPHFVEGLMRFFTPPKMHDDTIGAIMNAAEATMEGITEQTRLGLQYALEEHKTINVKMDLQAPLIILPLDPSCINSPVAILDAGHVSVISNLADKNKIEEIKSKENYSSKDWEELNTLMYDQFNLHLQDAQFFVGPNIKNTMEQLHHKTDRSSLVLDKLSVKLLLGISIIPEANSLARFKISGDIPNIHLLLSDSQYKTLMQLVDVLIPNLENSDSDDNSIFKAYGNEDKVCEIEDANSIHSKTTGKSDDTTKSGDVSKQKMLDVTFHVHQIHVLMSRCKDATSLEIEPLVELVGTSLDFTFYKMSNDMHVDLTLADIDILDYLENSGNPEFEKMFSSNNFAETESSPGDKKLVFMLNYERVQRLVQFNNKEIEVFDQDIKVDIATLKYVLSRKSYLSLMNFLLNTFTDPDAEATPADELIHNNKAEDQAPQKINLDVNLDSIIVVLNENGIKLATLQLSTANFKILLVPEEMDISGVLGALTLHDEINYGSPRDSVMRSLIKMQGNNLAEFRYRTYDPETNNDYHDSLFELKTGAITVNFVESSINRIYDYLNQFLQMKAIYDRAREVALNQASSIDKASKMKFDIVVKAPTVVFPRSVENSSCKFDFLTAQLGEIYAANDFVRSEQMTINEISTGIRNVNLRSQLNFHDEVVQDGHMIDDLDLSFNIKFRESCAHDSPMLTVVGKTPEIDLHLTELQLNYLYRLSETLSQAFTVSDLDEKSLENVVEEAQNANAGVKNKIVSGDEQAVNELVTSKEESCNDVHNSDSNKIEFNFNVPKLSLVTYYDTSGITDIDCKKFASFTLNKFSTKFEMQEDGNFNSMVKAKSFVVKDVREGTKSKYTEIIPPIKGDDDQFLISVTSRGSEDKRNVTVIMNVENPHVIVALDHVIVLQSFFSRGLKSGEPVVTYQSEELLQPDQNSNESEGISQRKKEVESANSGTSFGFSVNVKEPSITLLQDPTEENTLAVVFKVEQLLLTSQNVNSIAANNIGMFITRMDNFSDDQYRIIDDFSISFAHDSRGSNETNFLTHIEASIDPILLRVSLRDIRLALKIINNASSLYAESQCAQNENDSPNDRYNFSEDFKRRLSQYAPSILTNQSQISKNKSVIDEDQVIVKGEEFCASIGGLRFVLIGDVHELPVLDLKIKPFDVRAINWSTELSAEAHIDHFINIYNYSCSTWEPLIEPWPIAIYASKTTKPKESIVIDVVSRKLAEITLTSRSLALLSQVFNLIKEDDKIKSMGNDDPYIIVNETGYDVEVWADHDKNEERVKIETNGQISWSFEDWRQIRQNLNSNNTVGILGVKMIGSPYEVVRKIPANTEGEDLFMLYPPINSVHNRLSCEIVLGEDNVKTIYLRSTVVLRNDTDCTLEVLVTSAKETRVMTVESQCSRALPIDLVYSGSVNIKPVLKHSQYDWSDESLQWKSLLEGSVHLNCNSLDRDNTSYYFQAEAEYDESEPLARIYPHMKMVISSPVEIENLLPFDLDYRLYDKNVKKDWKGSVPKGEKSVVHVVNLKNLLLLSVEPKNCGLKKSEFAVINSPEKSDFKCEDRLTLRHVDGQLLHLKIHYPRKAANRASLRVSIYSPYVILNRTAQNIVVNDRNNLMQSNGKSTLKPVEPCLFSFNGDNERKCRATIKIADSTWSSPLSFDAIGQVTSVRTSIPGKQKEMNFGISIAEGEGKYNLSKVVTIAPRYVVRNDLAETIQLLEVGTTKQVDLNPGELMPLYGLRQIEKKNFMIKFAHLSNSWSSPFTLDDIGRIYLKAAKQDVGQVLLQINILIEGSTIFIQIESSNNNWPFSIRNFSDKEFLIYQNNPNINENGEVVRSDTEYKPIYYKIPGKSVMPYAYDYPNALIKEIIIRSNGRERAINLQEIGNLKPFRLPATDNSAQEIIDLNVVADGPTQSLIITNYDPSVSMYKLQGDKTGSLSSFQSTQKFEVNEEDENYYMKIVAKFEGFGISLINTRLQELCYITLRGLELRYNESDLYQNFSSKLKWIQIDNQLYGGIFPIVLYPSVIPKSGKEINNHPSFSASVCKVKDDSHGVLFLKYATVLLQEMTLEIDEDFLFALIDFSKVPGASWNKEQVDRLCDETLELPEPGTLSNASDIYFEALHLQPVQTNLSFVRTERINAEDKTSNQNALMFFFNVLTMAIGNINDAPIQLNALFLENIRVPIPILIESIQTHYGQSFFYQVHKILGSADFLGNPVGLFNHLASGVLDIFYEPYQGFVINDRPQELGIGLAKGGLSFLKKSVFGFSDSFAKVTGSIAKGLSVVTDKKFQEQRRLNQRRNKPKHALYGVANGANSFYESISSGFTGIATGPIKGASTEGAAGFFKGLGKGVIGLPTKTAIGLFDLASNVSEGIRNTTTVFDAEGLDKVRLPRQISHDGVIKPYSQREAQGKFWLNSLDGGVFFNERYLAHLLLSGEERAVLVTFKMIILFEVNLLKSKWIIEYGQIKAITVESTGISISLKRKQGPFLPIPDKTNRSFLYKKIAVAVEEFNKHCQVVI